MGTIKNAVCLNCEFVDIDELAEGRLVCSAYLFGVPEDIASGKSNHDTVRDDQVGCNVFTDPIERPRTSRPVGTLHEEEKPCNKCSHYSNGKCPAFDNIPWHIVRRIGHKNVFPGQNKESIYFKKR